MKGEFCRIKTADGMELQGFFVVPEGGPGDITILHIHGLAGNFYENRLVDWVAEAAVRRGVNFLTTNNRGHDYISDVIQESMGTVGYKRIGGAHEIFGECILDIRAWLDFLISRGAARFILEGHSHGALKVTHYLYRQGDPRVEGLILLSPSDDFARQRARIGERFDDALRVALDLIGTGRGDNLMPDEYFHYPISPRAYVDIFAEDSPLKSFNLSKTDTEDFPELESIAVPVLMLVGTVEEEFVGSSQSYLSEAASTLQRAKSFTGQVIDGAPHSYLGFEAELAGRIEQWLAGEFGR
jgi:pimeloyl-ACP methyl ester carboxylesterase